MIKFNPKNHRELTTSDCLDQAMKIKDQKEADQYLKDYIEYMMDNTKMTKEECDRILAGDIMTFEAIAKYNIGYWAGYQDEETRARIEKLFDCEHPMFGKISELGIPTPEEAFECGKTRKTLKEIRDQK